MLVTTFVAGEEHPAEHYNGVQQTLDGVRLCLSVMMSQGGHCGVATSNAAVVQHTTPSPTQVMVQGPARLLVPLTAPSLVGYEPFVKESAVSEVVTVPALNTVAGQSRNDLVVAKINVGQVNTNQYVVVQGTPATTGAQVDPVIPDNSYKLARITRAHGAGNIVTGMITDLRAPAKIATLHQA